MGFANASNQLTKVKCLTTGWGDEACRHFLLGIPKHSKLKGLKRRSVWLKAVDLSIIAGPRHEALKLF